MTRDEVLELAEDRPEFIVNLKILYPEYFIFDLALANGYVVYKLGDVFLLNKGCGGLRFLTFTDYFYETNQPCLVDCYGSNANNSLKEETDNQFVFTDIKYYSWYKYLGNVYTTPEYKEYIKLIKTKGEFK